MTTYPIEDPESVNQGMIAALLAAMGLGIAHVHATAEQLRNMFDEPIDLVEAQGAGKIIVPLFVIPKLTAGDYGFRKGEYGQSNAVHGKQGASVGDDSTQLMGLLAEIASGVTWWSPS